MSNEQGTLKKLGNLESWVIGPELEDAACQLNIVLCHGFGAPGTDLVPLGNQIYQAKSELQGKVRFIFPAAPISLEDQGIPGGRAWWPLDMMRLQMAIQTGEFRDLRKDSPEQLPEARELILSLLTELEAKTGIPVSKTILGGFSQGAMLATDVTFRLSESPAGLVIWSGTLLNEEEWVEICLKRAGLPVFQSHGRQDPILPFEAAIWLRDLLVGNGLNVAFHEFHGQHGIPVDSIVGLIDMISANLEK